MYGPGLDWAGRIVERVTGVTLLERMQERIFTPLGIHDAQFYPVTREDLRERMVDLSPDDPGAAGRAVLGGNGEMNLRTVGDFGGHGLFMSAESFVKILQSLLANDGKLLRPETADGMFEQHVGAEASAGYRAALESPMGVFFRVGVDLDTKMGYGLGGLVTMEDVPGWYGEGTMSWGGGQTLAWFIDRKNGLCGVGAVLANVPVDIPAASELKQVFRKGVYRKYAEWKEEQGI
ncbi:beta-lactamase/transpeptidase-like protein [Aspergillus varians]